MVLVSASAIESMSEHSSMDLFLQWCRGRCPCVCSTVRRLFVFIHSFTHSFTPSFSVHTHRIHVPICSFTITTPHTHHHITTPHLVLTRLRGVDSPFSIYLCLFPSSFCFNPCDLLIGRLALPPPVLVPEHHLLLIPSLASLLDPLTPCKHTPQQP